jgi:NADPH:quinone reductase-like Zn-dependent oxidoreductase
MNKAVKVVRFDKTGGSDVLRIEEIQLSRLRANEVLVRVQALTISRPDLFWRQGIYSKSKLHSNRSREEIRI